MEGLLPLKTLLDISHLRASRDAFEEERNEEEQPNVNKNGDYPCIKSSPWTGGFTLHQVKDGV